MKNVKPKKEKKNLSYLKKPDNPQSKEAIDESESMKMEHLRCFASIIINLYFSKQENKKS